MPGTGTYRGCSTIQLKDSATRVYDPDRRWGEFAKGAELPGEGVISPGERIRSEVAFQIAAEAEGFLLSFTLRTARRPRGPHRAWAAAQGY